MNGARYENDSRDKAYWYPSDKKAKMIIDVHIHSFPTVRGVRLGTEEVTSEDLGFVRREGKGLERFMPPSFVNTCFPKDMFVEYLRWGRIDKAVLFQSYVYGKHNDYYYENFIVQNYDKFRAFALVDPRNENISSEIENLVIKKKFTGIKIELPDLPIKIDHPGIMTCCELLERNGGTLGIDLGWEPESPYFFQLNGLKKILARFSKLRVHVTHVGLGGREIKAINKALIKDIAELISINANVMFDISAFPFLCSDDIEYPYPKLQELLVKILEIIPSDKIMWGSDSPQILRRCTYAQSYLWAYECPGLSEDAKAKLFYDNANRWYFGDINA